MECLWIDGCMGLKLSKETRLSHWQMLTEAVGMDETTQYVAGKARCDAKVYTTD